ncbi:LysR family transcriptional regulator [Microbacterium dextranolyticum]|uniref:LysR family transcriptional regulator n=1 Tax=Microbacterium dextranolyticum TaxID=36806 RepID=A0A9W6HKD9_9MICO|nr:LysR family transcriptional regulator [Microbacterium dextranolyticum]MBM7461882.1 DNA-binding transcriptional LysR family regulator [Microbacterium dextranolyticum]GLJ94123.1 LysR family transcriptional regulator [Microbacterium dextranolyticum]
MPLTDLNQLRTFVVLYELRSVTATAEALHVTQPTVSYTLRRLRERFGDDLFRREGHDMVPTARATQLFAPLHEALGQIDRTVDDAEAFDPASFTGGIRMGLTSIGEQTFLPPIMTALARQSSRPHLQVERLDSDQVEEGLIRGDVDLAMTVSLIDSPRLWRTHVRAVEYVALSSRAHPLPAAGPEMFAGRHFLRVSSRGGHVFPLEALTEHGLMPQVTLTVEEYATVPAVLQATDLVVLLPRHVAEVFCGWFAGLRIAELPWPAQSTPVSLYSRREASLSPVQRWFRSLVLDAVAAGRYRSGAAR